MDGNPLAFVAEPESPPDLEIRVNFGMFSGREATIAELDELAHDLLEVLPRVTIESVRRHEVDREVEAALHQVKVEASGRELPSERLLTLVDAWARRCIEERHAEIADVDALPKPA
jgi:hypothetical protein